MTSRADLAVPAPPPRTFDELFAEHNLTAEERAALVWHLAEFRARKTVEALLPETNPVLVMGFDIRDALR
jgi:hypothetical protein